MENFKENKTKWFLNIVQIKQTLLYLKSRAVFVSSYDFNYLQFLHSVCNPLPLHSIILIFSNFFFSISLFLQMPCRNCMPALFAWTIFLFIILLHFLLLESLLRSLKIFIIWFYFADFFHVAVVVLCNALQRKYRKIYRK